MDSIRHLIFLVSALVLTVFRASVDVIQVCGCLLLPCRMAIHHLLAVIAVMVIVYRTFEITTIRFRLLGLF